MASQLLKMKRSFIWCVTRRREGMLTGCSAPVLPPALFSRDARQGPTGGRKGGRGAQKNAPLLPSWSKAFPSSMPGPFEAPETQGNEDGEFSAGSMAASLHQGKRDQGSNRFRQPSGEGHSPTKGNENSGSFICFKARPS